MISKNSRSSAHRAPNRRHQNFSARPFRNSGRSFGKQRKGTSAGKIDPAKFINRAAVHEQANEYAPQHMFADFGIDERLQRTLSKKGYVAPTAIQDKTIPLLLEGEDVIGIANTGTGKTAAFLLPLITKVLKNKKERVLIIAPTRELAFQIHKELTSLAWGLQMYSTVCIGGERMGAQITQLRRDPHFVIGTPGRLKDLVERKCLRLEQFGNIVLDEADRMLDLGFIDDIRFLMRQLPETRQTLLFSATIPPAIETLIRTFLKNPIKISVKSRETAANVDQDIIRAKGREKKIEILCNLLADRETFSKVLVFGQTKHGVAKLSDVLCERGIRATAIHGDKTQANRRKALELFKSNKVQVLVATDVAARGLDISNVSHVINFDLPNTYEDYVHRIGRTGRANQKGIALTFVD